MNYIDIEFPYDEAENYLKPGNKKKINCFFYKGNVYDKIKKDTTYYLVGDKGSGKTAYSVYFCNNQIEGGIKSRFYSISVDDYNKIIQMKADGKLDYTHYITLWKAIILIKLCSSLEADEISYFGQSGYRKIKSLLKKYKFTKFNLDTFSPVSFMDSSEFCRDLEGGFKKDSASFKLKQSEKEMSQINEQKSVYVDNWVTFLNELSDEIGKVRLTNTHYLFIDGIDIRPSDIDFKSYSDCVYPLVRAVYEVNNSILSKIKDRKKGYLKIILLTRLDIFLQAGLSNPGSKLQDNCAYIDWNTNEDNYVNSEIFKAVNKMISQQNENIDWNSFFNYSIKRGSNSFDSFIYFLRLTTGKPRDYVRVLKILQNLCEANEKNTPDASLIESDEFQKAYSSYFVDKIRTALSFAYTKNEIDVLFDFLRLIGKITIKKRELEELYNGYSKKEQLERSFKDFNGLLKVLFDNDMICIIEKDGIYRWKYKETSIAVYDYNLPIENLSNKTKITFNWALEKSFSMYLKMGR